MSTVSHPQTMGYSFCMYWARVKQRGRGQSEVGVKGMIVDVKKYWKHIVIGVVCGVLNGLFGAGGGSIVVPAMEKFLDMDEKKSHATAIGIILLMSLVSSFLYIRNGYFDFHLWWMVTLGGVVGGLIGANVLSKISKRWLKIIFGGVIIITAVKMVI